MKYLPLTLAPITDHRSRRLLAHVAILFALALVSVAAQQIFIARTWPTNENGTAYVYWDFCGGYPTYSNAVGGLKAWLERATNSPTESPATNNQFAWQPLTSTDLTYLAFAGKWPIDLTQPVELYRLHIQTHE